MIMARATSKGSGGRSLESSILVDYPPIAIAGFLPLSRSKVESCMGRRIKPLQQWLGGVGLRLFFP